MTELRRKGRPATEAGATKGAQALDRGLEILQYLANAGGVRRFPCCPKSWSCRFQPPSGC